MNRSRAIAGTALVVAMLLAAAVASAEVIVVHGPVGTGSVATIDISLVVKHGKIAKLTRVQFNNVPASCQGFANTAVNGGFPHNIAVHKGKFHATQSAPGGKATYKVRGHFSSLHKAAGVLRVSGTVPGCRTADTGLVHWSAH